MSEENVDAFRALVAAVNRQGYEDIIRATDPEIVFVPQRATVQGAYVGHAELRRFWKDTEETFEVFRGEYLEVRDLGDHVLALGTLQIRGRGSGLELRVPSAIVAKFRDGLMVEFADYVDRKKALEAVDLS